MKSSKLLAFLLTAALVPGCGVRAEVGTPPVPLNEGYEIVYAADHGFAARDIFITQPDNPTPVNLTEDFGTHSNEYPLWSPDGTKIAFTMTEGPAFSLDRDANQDEIYVMNADGSNPINITSHPANDRDPSWSSDGSQIAFVSDRENDVEQIFVVNMDGSNLRQLTHGTERSWAPAWSPNGNLIAYDMGGEIMVMNGDGSNPRQLTRIDDRNDKFPVWSPDGTRIAFYAWVYDSNGEPWDQIFVINADGSTLQQLTRGGLQHFNPVWSPDGSRIAFECRKDYGDLTELYLMDSSGVNVTLLASDAGVDISPAWSLDGTRIVFVSFDGDGPIQIYLINSDGSNRKRLTQTSQFAGQPDWRP